MSSSVRLVVFVPTTHAAAVRQAMGGAGAGQIGNYSFCSFSVKGTGRFRPKPAAQPAIGQPNVINEVEEERIEVACDVGKVPAVIAAIKKVHPYEEVVIDLYPTVDVTEL